jgi:peptidyl-prolyl cis-trans isomerase D
MAAKKNRSVQNTVVWVLLGLLILGLAGFGVDGVLSQRVTTIGSVGPREITAQSYSRALRETISRIERETGQPLPLAQAQRLGIDAEVRARLVTQAALEAEAERIGISVSDTQVSRTIAAIPGFRGPGGGFDRDTYRFALENAGLTPALFEEDIRREAARGILQAATAAGVAVPDNLRGAIVAHFATQRDVSVFTLDRTTLTEPLADPEPSEVEAFYQANIARFTAPETRTIGYALLTPEMLLERVEVDAAAVRALYESRAAEFRRPERRLVERLVLPDQASAEAAAARLAEGATFEDLVAERGLNLDDTDMGDVTEAELGAAGPAVFALEEPGAVTGPHRSPLGPALFRMNAILAAQETPLDDVAGDLRAELAIERARRQIADGIDGIEDLIAGGAALADLERDAGMEVGVLEWQAGSAEGLAAYAEVRSAAAALREGEFLTLRTLPDGGVFVLELQGITPPTPRPLDEVRLAAFAGTRAAALEAALLARAEALAPELAAQGVEAFAEQTGLVAESIAGLTRLDGPQGLPTSVLEALLSAAAGETVVRAAAGQVVLGIVTSVMPADAGDEQTLRLVEAIDREIGGGMAQDVFSYFARALEAEAGIQLNQAAIDAVHAGFR